MKVSERITLPVLPYQERGPMRDLAGFDTPMDGFVDDNHGGLAAGTHAATFFQRDVPIAVVFSHFEYRPTAWLYRSIGRRRYVTGSTTTELIVCLPRGSGGKE